MRTLLLTAFSLLFTTLSWAQPANDDCDGLIDLGIVPTCPGNTEIYNNVDATASDIGFGNIPACFNGGSVDNDVWFSFTTTDDITDVSISVLGTDAGSNGSIMNPQIAIYRGSCEFDGLSELACFSSANGATIANLDILGLTPNETYFVRVNDYSATAAPNWGDFTICAEEYVPDINIGDETNTTACFGTLYDSGGPDGDYSSNENHTFTICPSDFNSCIYLDISSYNLENNFDFLNIYAGADVFAPQIAAITGALAGDGFPVQVSSECVTIEFTSDGSAVQAGFQLTWQCSPLECNGSGFDNPTVINSIPFNATDVSLCDGAATFLETPCGGADFINGPEYIFQYDSPGGLCAQISVTNALGGTGVMVLNGPPGDPGTLCVGQSAAGTIASVNFEDPGTYYIIVANESGCADFDISITETECALSPALVDALCNPLNGCVEDGGVPSIFMFEDGFQDVPMVNGVNSGCWLGVGAQPDFYWFTIEAQADGPFGFILESADIPSDIDFNVWGPFTNEEVCETPADIIDFITNNQPIRSSYAGGTEPTGLADIHPQLGYEIEDVYDCDGINDDIVQTIPAQVGEVYVVLANDWGNQIQGGGISVDWSPSEPAVLAPLAIEIMGQDTAVCPGETVQLSLSNSVDTYQWIDPTGTLSCTDCPNPIATVNETTTYQVVIDLVCYVDTVDVKVFVYNVDAGPDLDVCLGEQFQLSAGSNFDLATYEWDVPAGMDFSCIDCPDPEVTATTPGTYDITATLITDICTTTDTLTIVVNSAPAPEYELIDDITICEGEDINIGGAANPGVTYSWTSNPDGFISDEADPNVSPVTETTYILSAENGDCPTPVVDSVTISVDIAPIVSVANDTTICQGETITLGNTEIEEGVVYMWTGPDVIEADTFPNTTATPGVSGVYALNATRGACEVIETVNVEVVEIAVDIQQDTVEICLGESVDITALVLPGGAQADWIPNDGSLNTIVGNDVIATPEVSTMYFASNSVPGCARVDSIFIRVDSLPDLSIIATPEKDPYCPGETVTLLSNTYEPSSFPFIEHEWLSGPGYQTPDSLWNMVIITQDTFEYQRVTTNRACIDTASIVINVQQPPNMSIIPQDTTICEGQSVQLALSYDGDGGITWEPQDGSISCEDCLDPVVTPANTTSYTATSDDACPSSASANITVLNLPNVSVITDQTICDTETEAIQLFTGIPEAGVTYSWTSPDDPSFSSSDPLVTVLPDMTTTYELVAENDCGPRTASVTINVIEEPNLILNDETICLGDILIMQAESDLPDGVNEVFEWNYNGMTSTEPTLQVDDLTETTDITLNYTYGPGCGTITAMATAFVVGNNFSVTVDTEPDTVFIGGSVLLNANVISDPPLTGEVTYDWFIDGALVGTSNVPTFTATDVQGDPEQDITVPVEVTVTSVEGCVRMADTTLVIRFSAVEIPNVFTPNGDDYNDVFKVYATEGVNVSLLRVFNRWGQLVFESTTGEAWDGTFKGEPAQSDVYIYTTIYVLNGEQIEESGEITLLR
jgi:gliding motility-associated-like protein